MFARPEGLDTLESSDWHEFFIRDPTEYDPVIEISSA
jgi:hypothetical protein